MMRLSRWLVALGCVCLLALPAQAQNTVCTFSGAATDTNYSDYGSGSPGFVNNGPPGPANYFQLCQAGVGSTNWNIAFDQTAAFPPSQVIIDFDFSIGGTPGAGNYADGVGVALIPVSVYGNTGNGPGIVGEGDSAKDGAVSIGLDTFDNGNGDGAGSDLNNNAVSVNYCSTATIFHYVQDLTPANGSGTYQLHQDVQSNTFDHLNAVITFTPGGGATVTVTITSNQVGNLGDPGSRGGPGTSITPGTKFTPISGFVIPAASGLASYPMRVAFGARTGGATDNEDVANVNVQFIP